MSHEVTLEEVEQLVAQLPSQKQLKLMAWIGERLSVLMRQETDDERQRREYAEQIEAFLRMSEEMAAQPVGEVNSAEDIRQVREERMSRL